MLLRERGKMPLDLDLFQDKAEASIWTVKRISALQIMILALLIEWKPWYKCIAVQVRGWTTAVRMRAQLRRPVPAHPLLGLTFTNITINKFTRVSMFSSSVGSFWSLFRSSSQHPVAITQLAV